MSGVALTAGKSGVRSRRRTRTDEAVGATLDTGELFRRYGDMVLGRCRALLGNEADAQETAQEVFLRLHRYRDRFRGDARPSTYLYKITTTTCLNKIRSRKRRPEDPVAELPPTFHNDTMLEQVHIRELVDRLMATADEGTQAACIYHYVDGMTHAEAGELLGVSAAAVRKRIATFKKRLAANPPEWLVDEEEP